MDTYQRYKTGEHIFIRWLIESARKCGDISHLLPKSSQDLGASTIHVSTKNLLCLVEVMLKAEMGLEVPKDIMLLITDVIRLRKEQATFYLLSSSSQDAATTTKNDGHRHFIGVLERIVDSLRRLPGYAPPVKEDPSRTPHSRDKIKCPVGNIFSHLTVDEPVEWTSTSVRPPDNVETTVTETKYAFEEVGPRFEGQFATFCFWQDAYKMRLYLESQWEAYANDEISLISVAFVTNAAFSISRVANKKIMAAFPYLVGSKLCHTLQAVRAFYRRSPQDPAEQNDGVARGYLEEQNRDPNRPIPKSVTEISMIPKLLCLESLFLLRRYHLTMEARLDDPGFQPELSEQERFFSELKDTGKATNALEVIIDSASRLAEEGASTICGDQLLLNLTHLQTKAQPSCNGFACDVAMDIHRVLDKSRYKALNDLREIAASVANVIRHLWKVYAKALKNEPKFLHVQCRLMYVARFINEWIVNDAMTRYATNSRPRHIRRSNFDLLIAHPTLCGLIADTLLLRVHECGLHLCETEGLVVSVAHFYNAALQTSAIKHRWLEMDELISIQTPQHIFIGDTPTSIEHFYKRSVLALGQPLSLFASDKGRRANTGFARFTKQRRQLRESSVLLEAAQELRAQKRVDVYFYHLLNQADYLVSACMTSLEKTPEKRTNPEIQDVLKQWQTTKNLDQLQVLRALLFTKNYEVSAMSFDYLTMSLRCQAIMQMLYEVMKDQKDPSEDYQEFASTMIPNIIGNMSSSDPSLFRKAASALDSYLPTIEPLIGKCASVRQGARHDTRPLPLHAGFYMNVTDVPAPSYTSWELLHEVRKSPMHSACVIMNGLSVSLTEMIQNITTKALKGEDAKVLAAYHDDYKPKTNLGEQSGGKSSGVPDENDVTKKPKQKRPAVMKAGQRR